MEQSLLCMIYNLKVGDGMGSDDIFKKRKEARSARKHDILKPRPNSYLIVTEGAQTEPLYFKGLIDLIKENQGGVLDVVSPPYFDIRGEGRSTVSLIRKTDELVNKSKFIFQNIWVVFDKDDFSDFDEAIHLATEKGYHTAWTNQSFEYWLYLHFHYNDSALHRKDWCEKLDEVFKKLNVPNGKYEKNISNIYSIVNEFGSVHTAISNAKRRMSNYIESAENPSDYDPGTTVYLLVSELIKYL